MTRTYYTYNTPLGRLTIGSDGAAITAVAFGKAELVGAYKATALTNDASTQLLEYLAGKRREFDLPLNPDGSEFQRLVWFGLLKIPYGETRSYAQVAEMIGRPGSQRAVGGANNKNPLPLLIPCHRVVNADGSIGGYNGGTAIKRFLLDLESSSSSNESD